MRFVKSLFHSTSAHQAGLLLVATLSNIITQIVINALLARTLTQEGYGNYSYFINLFTFCQTIFNFGFFYTICRQISISNDDTLIRVYYYEGLKFLVLTSIVMIGALYVYSFIEISDLKRNGIETVFWIIAPLSCVYLITNYNEQIFQGNNDITDLAISRAVPKFIYAVILGLIFFTGLKLNLLIFLILYLCSHLLIYIVLLKRIKPKSDSISHFREILSKNKYFGINIYLGSLFSVGVANLMGLLISKYCVNNIELGFYNIALQITTPLTLIPNILSTVFFARFANNETLKKNIVLGVVLISFVLYTSLFLLSDFIVGSIFGNSYLPSAKLIRILGIGSLLYGIADFFNRYILARGKSIIIRNIAFTIGITYLIIGFVLIPTFLAIGASYAKVITGFIYLLLEVFFTLRVIKMEKN